VPETVMKIDHTSRCCSGLSAVTVLCMTCLSKSQDVRSMMILSALLLSRSASHQSCERGVRASLLKGACVRRHLIVIASRFVSVSVQITR